MKLRGRLLFKESFGSCRKEANLLFFKRIHLLRRSAFAFFELVRLACLLCLLGVRAFG